MYEYMTHLNGSSVLYLYGTLVTCGFKWPYHIRWESV